MKNCLVCLYKTYFANGESSFELSSTDNNDFYFCDNIALLASSLRQLINSEEFLKNPRGLVFTCPRNETFIYHPLLKFRHRYPLTEIEIDLFSTEFNKIGV